MTGNAHQIDIHRFHIKRNFAERLRAIGMEKHAALAADFANLCEGLNHANFVIDSHHRNDGCFIGDRGFEHIKINQTIRLDRKIGDFESLFFQMPCGIEHAFMLGYNCDDMIFFIFIKTRNAFDGDVIGFRRAGCEDDFFFGRANERGNLFTRKFACCFGFPSIRMAT